MKNYWEHRLYQKVTLESVEKWILNDANAETYNILESPMDNYFKFTGMIGTHTAMGDSIVLCDGNEWPYSHPSPKFFAAMEDEWETNRLTSKVPTHKWNTFSQARQSLSAITNKPYDISDMPLYGNVRKFYRNTSNEPNQQFIFTEGDNSFALSAREMALMLFIQDKSKNFTFM